MINKDIKVKKQQGFAAQGIVLLAVVVAVVIGGGYYVLSRQELSDTTSSIQTEVNTSTVANGTPENAVNAVNQQLTEEIANEVSALDTEDKDAEIDSTAIDELEGVINESNL
jgi:uncharacterized protein HemX